MVWYDTNETLEAMGYGPEARRQRHEDNMRVLESAALGAVAGYGVSKAVQSWRERRAETPAKVEAQNLKQANGQSAATNRWILEQQRRWNARQQGKK